MVEEKFQEVLHQTLDLLDTACQANLELLSLFQNGKINETVQLLQDMRAVIQAVSSTGLAEQMEHSYATEMMENVEDTLEDIERAIQSGNPDRAAMKMEFQLFPFLRQLRESFYFWGAIYPSKEKMAQYYREEFAEHVQNFYIQTEQPAPYQLSIVIPAYNHLETTKRCIEQLRKETDFEKLNAELILIDHGSTDGTLEYFESLGIGKVIHFKHNVRMYAFSVFPQLCQGRFFVFVSNDILVTKNWAEILLDCMKSDSKIIAAVPATPNIANLQMLHCPTNDPEGFIHWANQQNKSDPTKWDDRARLMPPIGMYRTDAVSKIGFADPYFYTMEFWDDDFSMRARRAGYRQIVCSDVACYHFGSVTGKEAQQKENTLVHGRELFLQKNGIDAWGIGFCYDYPAVQLFKQLFSGQKQYTVLGLDCGIGDTLLQIRNELRHLHQECNLYQLTSQKENLLDVELHSKQAFFAPELVAGLETAFGSEQFDLVYLGQDIGEYPNFQSLLEAVSHRMISNGIFIFFCSNPFYVLTIHALLQFSLPGDEARCVLADPEQMKAAAEQYFSQVQIISSNRPVDGMKEFAMAHFGKTYKSPHIMNRLGTDKYYFVCKK